MVWLRIKLSNRTSAVFGLSKLPFLIIHRTYFVGKEAGKPISSGIDSGCQ